MSHTESPEVEAVVAPTAMPAPFTTTQVLNALYALQGATNAALVAYYTTDQVSVFHKKELRDYFKKAAFALGFDLVPHPAIDDEHFAVRVDK
jgi:hypothetical protein